MICLNYHSHPGTIYLFASTATATASPKKYRTYTIKTLHVYQQITPSHLHSIDHYYATCEEEAKQFPSPVMVLRDEVTRITE